MIAEAAADAAAGKPVYWLPDREIAARVIGDLLDSGDLVLVMGAGDIDELGRRLAQNRG
jgi:UDP-N-acetylmuramate--alanine ligase